MTSQKIVPYKAFLIKHNVCKRFIKKLDFHCKAKKCKIQQIDWRKLNRFKQIQKGGEDPNVLKKMEYIGIDPNKWRRFE